MSFVLKKTQNIIVFIELFTRRTPSHGKKELEIASDFPENKGQKLAYMSTIPEFSLQVKDGSGSNHCQLSLSAL